MASAKWAGLVAAMAIAGIGPAAAQGTDAQREACTPDAFRLCMAAMPDAGRVEGCLRSNGPRLSAACYAVFFNPPQDLQATGTVRVRPQRDNQQRVDRRLRDDGFSGFQQRDYQPRPQPLDDDE